jgi:class 3 adenylate cyclase
MDAVGSEQAALLATGPEAGPMALFFAGTRPQRTAALVLSDATARYLVDDDYPIGVAREAAETMIARVEELWGTETLAGINAPSRADDERFLRWSARLQRAIASPRVVRTYLPLFWDQPDPVLEVVEEFLVGAGRSVAPSRVVATVLFADIVGSTQQAGRLGDRRWRELLQIHDELAGRLVERWGGRLVKTTGDGILASFDGPGRAIGCAAAFGDQLALVDLEIRAGLHSGEVELRGDDIGGIAVHIAARVLAAAGPGEILVSRTVRDLVVGSDVVLEDRGTHPLKGVEGRWQLFAVSRPRP